MSLSLSLALCVVTPVRRRCRTHLRSHSSLATNLLSDLLLSLSVFSLPSAVVIKAPSHTADVETTSRSHSAKLKNMHIMSTKLFHMLISKAVGDAFNEGIYEEQAQLRGIPLLESKPKYQMWNMTAKEACGSARVKIILKLLNKMEAFAIRLLHFGNTSSGISSGTIVAIVVPIAVAVLIFVVGIWILCKRATKKRNSAQDLKTKDEDWN